MDLNSHALRSLCALALLASPAWAQDEVLYDDAVAAGYQDWSWAVHSMDNPAPVAAGSRSISFEADDFGGVYFRASTPLNLADWSHVELQIHGGSAGGQGVRLLLQLGTDEIGTAEIAPPAAGAFTVRTLDLRAAGLVAGLFDGIIFQGTEFGDQPTLFLDEIRLLRDQTPPPPPTAVEVEVDPSADRRAINPWIYGVAFGDSARVAEVGYPVRRWGGNSMTRYNWRAAVHNTAFDYFFQNIVNEVRDEALLPEGSSSDIFIDETLAAGAEVLMTAPAIGWTALDTREKKWSFSQQKYGPQRLDECRFYEPDPPFWCSADSGDGTCDPAVNTTGFCSPEGVIVGNDPADTSLAITPEFVGDWVDHVVSRVGRAEEGGVKFWAVDNEPMLWNSTHRDVFTTPLTDDELWSRTLAVSSAIKGADPSAEVFGPVVWGWCAYFSSAADVAFPNGSCTEGPDREAHDNLPLLEWYLQQNCAAEQEGVRPIDYLDVHFYPQGGASGLEGPSEDPINAAKRMRSVAELWDPSHVSDSWINQPIFLIPRLRSWIEDRCPGTRLAITEYRWGEDNGASSAVAHAEVLALFGREGVDLATRWVAPEPGSRVEDAFELFLNYDGDGARIEGESVRATSNAPADLGSYAVAGPEGEVWVILINRDISALEVSVAVAGEALSDGAAPVYRFDGSTPLAPAGTVAVSGSALSGLVLPPRSASLVVLSGESSRIFAADFESGDTLEWAATQP
ncbi:MAG: glycoside hydrolase family 44 protein [Acidobacteriota bacterium]